MTSTTWRGGFGRRGRMTILGRSRVHESNSSFLLPRKWRSRSWNTFRWRFLTRLPSHPLTTQILRFDNKWYKCYFWNMAQNIHSEEKILQHIKTFSDISGLKLMQVDFYSMFIYCHFQDHDNFQLLQNSKFFSRWEREGERESRGRERESTLTWMWHLN